MTEFDFHGNENSESQHHITLHCITIFKVASVNNC